MGMSPDAAPGWRGRNEEGAWSSRRLTFSARAARNADGSQGKEAFAEVFTARLRQSLSGLDRSRQHELDSLRRETDPDMYFRGLLAFGRRLESAGAGDKAATVYAAVEASGTPGLRELARSELDALTGRGVFAARADRVLKNFADTATDYRVVVPMLAGSAVYHSVRAVALGRLTAGAPLSWATRGWGARVLAGTAAWGAEVSVFTWGQRQLSGAKGSWGDDAVRAALTLGVLKVSGWTGKQAAGTAFFRGAESGALGFLRGATPQVAGFLGLLAAQEIEARVGLLPNGAGTHGFADTLANWVGMSVGARLGSQVLGGGFARFQGELELRSRGERASPPAFELFPNGRRPLAAAEIVSGAKLPQFLQPWKTPWVLMATGKPPGDKGDLDSGPFVPRPYEDGSQTTKLSGVPDASDFRPTVRDAAQEEFRALAEQTREEIVRTALQAAVRFGAVRSAGPFSFDFKPASEAGEILFPVQFEIDPKLREIGIAEESARDAEAMMKVTKDPRLKTVYRAIFSLQGRRFPLDAEALAAQAIPEELADAEFPVEHTPVDPIAPVAVAGSGLPPDRFLKLPRGGVIVRTSQGWIQVGVPPWTNKDALELYLSQKGFEQSRERLPHLIPTTYLFDLDYVSESHGLLPADFIQYMYFVAQSTTFQLVAPDPETAQRLKAFLDLSYMGPTDAEALSAQVRSEYLLGARGVPDLGRETREGFRGSPHPEVLRQVTHLNEAGEYRVGELRIIKREALRYEFIDQGTSLGILDLRDHLEPRPVLERSLSLAADSLTQGVRKKVLVEGRPGLWPIGTGHGFTPKEETSGFMIWNQGRVTLLDPPSSTLEYLSAHGIPLGAVEGVIITHGHTDHHGPAVPMLLRALPKINVYTTSAIRDMLQKQYDLAIGNHGEGLVQWNFSPLYPQNFKKINGLHMVFDYSFHPVPAMMLRIYDRPDLKRGKLMWLFSGDTLLDQQEIWGRTLKGPKGETPVMGSARAKIVMSPVTLLHSSKGQKPAPHMAWDAGIRPVHAGPEKFREYADDARELGVDVSRLAAYHVSQDAADQAGIPKLQAGPKGFIDFSEFFPHLEPSGWEDYVARILDQTPLLHAVPAPLKLELAGQSLQSFDAGITVIEEGRAGEDVYFLIDGEVEIWRRNQRLALRPNGVLGEGALFGEARNATVVTTVASLFLKVNAKVMAKILEGQPLLADLDRIRRVRAEAYEAVLRSSWGNLPDSILDMLFARGEILTFPDRLSWKRSSKPAPDLDIVVSEDATASGPVKILRIPATELKRLTTDYPGIGIALKRGAPAPDAKTKRK